jgi:ABC-type transport system involved in multi-copper enzyme maturation permease subunit
LIWLTWRQSRLKAASAAVVLAAFAVLLAVTGPPLASLYAGSRIGSCRGSDCVGPADDFLQQLYGSSLFATSSVTGTGTYWLLYLLGIVIILVAPAIIGIFWGAPLIASEFEAGTDYLAWNQSITRTRWLAVKLMLTGLVAMAVTEALSLMQAWWATPISRAVARGAVASPLAMNQFSPLVFATHGITPLGYAAFAFALGVTAGVLVRRAVPAMALTLAVFAVLQVAMPLWVRPHLFPPDHTVTTLSSFSSLPGVSIENGTFTLITSGWDNQPEGWVLSSGAVNAAGKPVSAVPAACMQVAQVAGGKAGNGALLDCLASHGIRVAVTYQPASRYWAFQWTETAIYVALALALAGYCFWRIRRRLS